MAVSEDTWDTMVEVNLRSGFFLGRAQIASFSALATRSIWPR